MKNVRPIEQFLNESKDIEAIVATALKKVAAKGFTVDAKIVVDAKGEKFANDYDPDSALAMFRPDENTVYINGTSRQLYNYTPGKKYPKPKFNVVGPMNISLDPIATIYHEIAHALHHAIDAKLLAELSSYARRQEPWRVPELHEKKNMVSEYALSSWAEFVAEVFAGTMMGMKFSPVVWQHYAEHKGPPFKQPGV